MPRSSRCGCSTGPTRIWPWSSSPPRSTRCCADRCSSDAVAQSVELLLDDHGEEAVRRQWDLLANAGLPSERRSGANEHHRPHLTLFAADEVPSAAEPQLPGLVVGLDLEL